MKKIMFSTEYGLQQGVIARTKTMTRRVDKKLNHPLVTDISEWGIDDKGKCYLVITYSTGLTEDVYPAYQIGEEIAIAQSYHMLNKSGFVAPEGLDHTCESSAGYENKMFVRADLMPHHICITDIKAERLQDISEADCLREGIVKTDCVAPYGFSVGNGKWKNYRTPQDAFACLIDKVSGTGTWNRNPWVFAYTFELVR